MIQPQSVTEFLTVHALGSLIGNLDMKVGARQVVEGDMSVTVVRSTKDHYARIELVASRGTVVNIAETEVGPSGTGHQFPACWLP